MKAYFVLKKLKFFSICLSLFRAVFASEGMASSEAMLSTAALQLPQFDDNQYKWIAEKIFVSETGGRKKNLTFWGKNESFPSMGIGHQVWLPKNWKPKENAISFLEDRFSGCLQFFQSKELILPRWFIENPTCPWETREDFKKDRNKPELKEVRAFLFENRAIHAEYITIKFLEELPLIIEKLPAKLQPQAVDYCNTLLATPEGTFALIDYNHFKGHGLSGGVEAYNNHAWGLLQVLERVMTKNWQENPLDCFIESAKETLLDRIENAPEEQKIIEKSYKKGWFKRVERYGQSF